MPPPRKGLAFGAFLVAATLLALAPLEQSQAQLYIDIFPSQDDTNATLWVFSGSSRAGVTINNVGPYIRRSGGYNRRDTIKTDKALLQDPISLTPAANYNLTALRTASATNSPLDFESLRARLGHTIKLGTTNTLDDITIPSTATNVPTMSYAGRGSRTLAAMHLNNVSGTGWDDVGPRVTGSSDFNYGTGQPNVNWVGAGVMTNKPISHFHLTDLFATNPNDRFAGNRRGNAVLRSFTGWEERTGLRIRVHGKVIPEPQEYALVFGLFALGFVVVHRHRQKKKRQTQATTS